MSKVLIIVTSTSAGYIYDNFKKKYLHIENNGVLEVKINGNKIFVIDNDNASNLTESINTIIASCSSSTIHIYSHTGYIAPGSLTYEVMEFRHMDAIGSEFLRFAKKEISFDNMWRYLEKKRLNYLTANLLHLFLPLDIDMQALKFLLDKNENEKAQSYLNECLEVSGSYHKEILERAEELLNQIEDEDKKKIAEAMFEKSKNGFGIRDFLEMLSKLEPNHITLNDNLEKGIKSFHEWYKDLAEELRKLFR